MADDVDKLVDDVNRIQRRKSNRPKEQEYTPPSNRRKFVTKLGDVVSPDLLMKLQKLVKS